MLYEYDKAIRTEFPIICGVDEAGRGPLAGPVYAAAVILDDTVIIEDINDSKKLTEKKRERLYDEIISNARSYCIATASVDEIEQLNILWASMLAMKRAIEGLDITPDIALIDGNRSPDVVVETRAVIKGDATSASIAAASILAKVARDREMLLIAKEYPQYQFEKHKGYGTKLHREMLLEHGPSEVHRLSFLKKIINADGQ